MKEKKLRIRRVNKYKAIRFQNTIAHYSNALINNFKIKVPMKFIFNIIDYLNFKTNKKMVQSHRKNITLVSKPFFSISIETSNGIVNILRYEILDHPLSESYVIASLHKINLNHFLIKITEISKTDPISDEEFIEVQNRINEIQIEFNKQLSQMKIINSKINQISNNLLSKL